MKNTRLGRGIEDLLKANRRQDADDETLQDINIGRIRLNPHQPRKEFTEEALQELSDSIDRHGLLQPVLVRQEGGDYELIAGERRLRACQKLNKQNILARVVSADRLKSAELALIENLQREDLSPLECARAYRVMMESFALSQQDVALKVGKKRSTIANTLRLLELDHQSLEALEEGLISVGHAKALLAIDNVALRQQVCRKLLKTGLTVRQVEQMATRQTKETQPKREEKKDPNIRDLEERFRRELETQVTIQEKGNRGKITIEFYSLDDFERIAKRVLGS